MDLSYTRFDVDAEPIAMPHDLALLMVGIAARQAASPTAAAQAGFARAAPDPRLFEPLDGAFNGATACALARWHKGESGRDDEHGGGGHGSDDRRDDGCRTGASKDDGRHGGGREG